MEEQKKFDPFVFTNESKKTDPLEKRYLLLLSGYDESGEYVDEWNIIQGRANARQYIIGNIERIDPKKSYIMVENDHMTLDITKIPTVYQLFTDKRSSWNDPNIFQDGFDINQVVEDYGEDEIIEATQSSLSSVEAVNHLMTDTDGQDI